MRHAFFTLLFLGCAYGLHAQNQTLTITFGNIKKAKGDMMISLQNRDSSVARGFIVPIKSTEDFVYEISDLPPGEYAVKAFQDVNSDKELNTNMLGIPNEPYGFSNNFKPMFGPPNLEDLLFSFPAKKAITMTMQ